MDPRLLAGVRILYCQDPSELRQAPLAQLGAWGVPLNPANEVSGAAAKWVVMSVVYHVLALAFCTYNPGAHVPDPAVCTTSTLAKTSQDSMTCYRLGY